MKETEDQVTTFRWCSASLYVEAVYSWDWDVSLASAGQRNVNFNLHCLITGFFWARFSLLYKLY